MAKTFALAVTFPDAPSIYHASEKIRDAGFTKWDVITPYPVHGLDGAMGIPRSRVPWFTLVGGVSGFTLGNLLTWFMGEYSYPLILGGKPFWSPIFPFPVHYEMTILFAAFGTLGGMFLLNQLPRHNHPVFNHPNFKQFSDDKFCLYIQSDDPKFDLARTRELLLKIGGTELVEIADEA